MRALDPQTQNQGHDVDHVYFRAAQDHLMTLQHANDDVTSFEYLQNADEAQNDGKIKFQEKNYYAAKNAFLTSLDAVLQHQKSEYYGKSVPVKHWDELEMQERYVMLCNNIAICGLKLKDCSIINDYALKALNVDQSSKKALYAMTKLRLMEHRYTEANEIVEKALQFHPDKAQFLNLRKEVKAAQRKEALKQAELMEIRATQMQTALAAAKISNVPEFTQEEKEQQLKLAMQKRLDETPLPTREDDTFAASRLYGYFIKIKQRMMVDIQPRYNADKGEEALFECTIANGTTGEVLAANVQGTSKKIVKNEACKIVIEKLWNDKQAADKLTPEDLVYLERFERAKASGHPLVNEPVVLAPPQQALDNSSQLPARVSWVERQLQPLPLLNQLTQRGILQARFDVEDVSPKSKEFTEFKCMGYLNGEHIATANAISKKKARAEVAQQVLAAAFDKNLLMVYDASADEDESGAPDEKNLDESKQATSQEE
ncbi:hypothetical protein KXD40_009590 [Peronospora effusa]|nr:hypothetical protein KXD40_009590 [Peronospora effusa]